MIRALSIVEAIGFYYSSFIFMSELYDWNKGCKLPVGKRDTVKYGVHLVLTYCCRILTEVAHMLTFLGRRVTCTDYSGWANVVGGIGCGAMYMGTYRLLVTTDITAPLAVNTFTAVLLRGTIVNSTKYCS